MKPGAAFFAIRIWVAAFSLVTAAYCLLAYIPFTYHQVYLGGLLPWLAEFARLHVWLYWPTFFASIVTLPGLRNDRTRLMTVWFVFVYGIIGVELTRNPLLTRLLNDGSSLVLAVAALSPLLWIAALDIRAKWAEWPGVISGHTETARIFRACALSAGYLAFLFTAITVIRDVSGRERLGATALLLGFGASFAAHFALFMALFLVLNFVRTVSLLVSARRAVHMLMLAGTAALAVAFIVRSIIFAPLSFSGIAATGMAVALAVTLVAYVFGILLQIRLCEALSTKDRLLLAGFLPQSACWQARGIWLVALSTLGGYALHRASRFDWGTMLQSLTALTIGLLIFVFFYAPVARCPRSGSLVIAAAAVLIAYGAICAFLPRWQPVSGAGPSWTESLERYRNYDPGFRLARTVLTLPTASSAGGSLYVFLAHNTNIPRSVRTPPVEINLVRELVRSSAAKPNIFIFVIDSLRRDYLSPYNAPVSFTPGIQQFARESVVFPNAFTRYAGTGLSEPSIWAGAMLLHKQYVTPFYPMNSLQKLLNTDGYRQFITKDEILSTLLAPSPLITELDKGRPTMNCRLCQTLAELQTQIAEAAPTHQPLFAYTQPQDLHISVIDRAGRMSVSGKDYRGFDAAYASRVERLDHCFAEFIQFLKQQNLYDDSIVILTSDHGDSLGERGRWGHAYSVVPEVMRVPLIVHLPRAMQALVSDQRSPAFLIDITPSLYYLLGHRPIANDDLYGRPLFTETPEEAKPYARDSYLLASSYAPVYGILGNTGDWMYVADGVAYKDHLYRWNNQQGRTLSSTASGETRIGSQRLIYEYVTEIGHFYQFDFEKRQPEQSARAENRQLP